MLRVIVDVRCEGEKQGRDLEVPAEIAAEQLAESLAQALQLETSRSGIRLRYLIRAHPQGRALRDGESLADAGIWDGACLVLMPTRVAEPRRLSQTYSLRSESGTVYPLPSPNTSIGRAQRGVEVQGPEWVDLGGEPRGTTVSRNHARLVFGDGRWRIIPAPDSANPTLVNDRVVERGQSHPLANGDLITLGQVTVVLQIQEARAAPVRDLASHASVHAYLIPTAEDGSEGTPVPLRSQSVRIGGPGEPCDVSIQGDMISSPHARIEERADGSFIIFDEYSEHGTYVGGALVGADGTRLRDGDRIQLGSCAFVFRCERTEVMRAV